MNKPGMRIFGVLASAVFLSGCGKDNDQIMKEELGYQGSPELWSEFLQCWTEESIATYSAMEDNSAMEREVLDSGNQGFAPATYEAIASKEKHLNVVLPKSYKDFLLASNGWRQPMLDSGDGLVLPVERIGFFSDMAPEFYSIVAEDNSNYTISAGSEDSHSPVDYSQSQDSVIFEESHFVNSIAISEETDSGIYLINTHRTTPEGEFEFWFYSSNHPGVYKFVSFAHLMQYAYIKTIHKPEYNIPYDASFMIDTCAAILGFPRSDSPKRDTQAIESIY